MGFMPCPATMLGSTSTGMAPLPSACASWDKVKRLEAQTQREGYGAVEPILRLH